MDEQEPEIDTDNPFVVMTHIYPDAARIFSRRIGMNMSRIEILHELFHGVELSQTALQKRLSIDGGLMTRTIKQMEHDGLVTRRVDPSDNRFTLVALAPAGKQSLDAMDQIGEDFRGQLLKGLDHDEQRSLTRMLLQIYRNLKHMVEEDANERT